MKDIKEHDWALMAKRYNAGKMTVEQCRRKAQCRRNRARELLAKNGAKIYKSGSGKPVVDEARCVEMKLAGYNLEAIQNHFNIGYTRLVNILRRNGVDYKKFKQHGRRPGERETKFCIQCGLELPVTEFYRSGPSGRRSECKACHRQRVDSVKRSPHVKQVRSHQVYWNPWAEGEVMTPPGVSSNSILMCPLR